MIDEYSPIEKELSTLIYHAALVLQLTPQEIKFKYAQYPVCVLAPLTDKDKDYVIEIRFDKEQSTLSCSFDSDHICRYSVLFLDDLDKVSNYITYLNSKYEYHYLERRWQLPSCFLSIKKSLDDICLMFYP